MKLIPQISLMFDGRCEEALRFYEQVLGNAVRVDMSLQETFWARRFGTFVDQFGVPWSINCE